MGYLDYLQHGTKMFLKKGADAGVPGVLHHRRLQREVQALPARRRRASRLGRAVDGVHEAGADARGARQDHREHGEGSLMFLLPTGGEPFLRKDIGEIVKIFHKNTGVRNVGIPTNGSTTARTVSIVEGRAARVPRARPRTSTSRSTASARCTTRSASSRASSSARSRPTRRCASSRSTTRTSTSRSRRRSRSTTRKCSWRTTSGSAENLDVDTVFTLLTRGSPKEPLAKFFDVEKYEEYADHMEQEYKSGSLSRLRHFPFADFINAKRIVRHNLIAKIARDQQVPDPVLRRESRRLHVRERRHLSVRAADRPQARQRPRRRTTTSRRSGSARRPTRRGSSSASRSASAPTSASSPINILFNPRMMPTVLKEWSSLKMRKALAGSQKLDRGQARRMTAHRRQRS